jgi:transposase InsO family protein
MPWKDVSIMSQREEFVALADQEGANVRQLCGRFGISRKTAYKWRARYAAGGTEALADQSRRPRGSPGQTSAAVEAAVLAVRQKHPAWGGRKIRARLQALGQTEVPAASTITAILRRHGCINPEEADRHRAFERFEHAAPNDLWQMDFKGHVAMADGRRCHPLTVLDDHSRYAVGLRACADERGTTVAQELTELFRVYGLPRRMLMDNGSPWGDEGGQPYTALTVWLLRLGVGISHGRPRHPQTQGKDERFHRTLKAEVLRYQPLTDLADSQRRFDAWRLTYNVHRPHEALGMAVPCNRYQPSTRAYPEILPAIEYGPGDAVRKVQNGGWFSYAGKEYRVSSAFQGQPIALRPMDVDGKREVWFCHHCLGSLDLRGDGDSGVVFRRRGNEEAACGGGRVPPTVAALPPAEPAPRRKAL